MNAIILFPLGIWMCVETLLFTLKTYSRYRISESLKVLAKGFPHDYSIGGNGEEIVITAIGDSRLAGQGAKTLKETPLHQLGNILSAEHAVRIINLCEPGERLSATLEKLADIPQETDVLIISTGSLDSFRCFKPRLYQRQLDELCAWARHFPAKRILLLSPSNPRNYPLLPYFARIMLGALRKRQNVLFTKKFAGTRIQFIDAFHNAPLDAKHFCADGAHQNAQGYEILMALVWEHW
jgi:lysophospholipase L1-like esterase